VIAHQTNDIEPSITITGMYPAVERDGSGYVNGLPSRGVKIHFRKHLNTQDTLRFSSVQPLEVVQLQ
jgi:hypothetical protein